MPTITCVEDFGALYQRRVSKMFFDDAESGSYSETTFKKNAVDFGNIHIRQGVGIDVSGTDTSTTMSAAAA